MKKFLASLSNTQEPARILVVDDNEINRDVLARRLKQEAYVLEMACGGQEALELLQKQPFDAVLLDIMMPEIDGMEVLRRVKADEDLQHLPVIVISALDDMESVIRCIELGAEDYLPKPFSPTLLKARVRACVEKKRTRDRERRLFLQLEENYTQLRALEQQRDDLAHMLIHDMRSPLSANLTGLEMIEFLGPLNPEQRDCLQVAMRSGRNLLGLINDMLDTFKLESGALKLDKSSFEVSAVVKKAVDQMASLLLDKNLLLQYELEETLPLMYGDEGKIERVLVNLLSNAIKFTPPGGQITIVGYSNTNELSLAIRDTGEGIAPEALERIFEKFGQAQNRKAGHQNSTGLGLAFCKLVIEAHGGRIGVESIPGEGSTFFITVPVKNQ
jgi:two-component system sensor histidine kinase/response regulator